MNTEQIMKKCQTGSHNLNDANNLLAECYGTIGLLTAQRDELLATMHKLACLGNGDKYGNSIGNVIAQEAIAKCEAQS